MLCLWSACDEGETSEKAAEESLKEIPSMATYDVSMLISDSGVIKYRASADTWLHYGMDKSNEYQYFPQGIFLEQLDSAFNSAASIQADTAYNYETKQLWHLIKNVHIVNAANEHFYTQELFWNVRTHKVYSDSTIRIERPDAILIGVGFESDDRFTNYTIRKPTGIFPLKEANSRPEPTPAQPQSARTAEQLPKQ